MADYAVTGDPFETNPEMKQYFDSLPPYVQETLRQSSGGQIANLAQLRQAAEHLLQKQGYDCPLPHIRRNPPPVH